MSQEATRNETLRIIWRRGERMREFYNKGMGLPTPLVSFMAREKPVS